MDINWLSCGAALVERGGSGIATDCNVAFRELLGKSSSSNNKKKIENVWDVLGITESEASEEETSEAVVGSKWLSIRCMAVPDNDNLLFLEVTDVTQRRDAEQRALNFLELSFDGFFDYQITQDYEYMSPRFWEMFGYKPEEKRHHPSEWQAIIFQEDLPALFAQLEKHVASRGAIPFRSECRYHHKNGSTVVVSCNGRVIEWAQDGSPLRMIGTHTDITKLRQEQKLSTEHRIHDYLAHMIRNPLTSAVGASQFLQSAMLQGTWQDERMEQEVERDLATVHDNLMVVSSLVARLAELHNIYSGSVSFVRAPASICKDVLEPAKEQLALLYTNHQCPVDMQIKCDPPSLRATVDVLRLKQTLVGILEGAAARMVDNQEGGTIRVVARAAAAAVNRGGDGSTSTSDDFLVEIEDTGQTIATDDDLLLGGSSDGVQQSTSSGLHPSVYVSRALALGMGGSLSIDHNYVSEVPGQGLRMVLRLPGLLPEMTLLHAKKDLTGEAALEKQDDATSIDKFFENGRILVIDDDKMVNKLWTRRLTKLIPGAQVECAYSGEQGVELAKRNKYSLYIVDHYMPGPGRPLTGAETITQMRLLGIMAPMIGCSANDVSAKHLQAGANSFLQKPVPKDNQLVRLLNSVVPRGVGT